MTGSPWYSRAVELYDRTVRTGDDLAAVARLMVLLALEAGPRLLAELPRGWPVTRAVLRATVPTLIAEGVVAGSGPGSPRLMLTGQGQRAVRAIRARRAA